MASFNFDLEIFCDIYYCGKFGDLYNTIQYILNWPLPIGAFQGQWNTTKRQNRTTTTVKNPNWLEANQLAIYKCSWEVEPGTTRIKFNEWSERVLNPGSPDLKASALTTGLHCLLWSIHKLLEYSRSHKGDQLGIGRSQSFCLLQSACYK